MSAQTAAHLLAPPSGSEKERGEASRRSVLRVVGVVALALAVLLGLFVCYELWGTSLVAARSQQLLLTRFREALPTTILDDPATPVVRGEPVALLVVPSIGLSQVVVEGSSPSELTGGPGHVPATPMPGEFGNAVVLGKRCRKRRPVRGVGLDRTPAT